jgi:hypothetical protein
MRYPQGLPGWVDLTTSDPAAATSFYTALFGWSAEQVPTDAGPPYTMLRLDGRLVAGLGPQTAEMQSAGAPPTWNTYVLVGDVDEIVTAAVDAGGRVLMPAMDVMGSGRLGMIADPAGAALGLWQPRDHQGADVFNVPGAVCWNELQSRDLAAALPFYEELFAWRWERSMAGGGEYFVAHLDAKGSAAEGVDTSVAGAMAVPPGLPDEVPSTWGVYVSVADLDETVARAHEHGGSSLTDAMSFETGRFAVLADPQGAVFNVMQMADV